MTNKEPRLGWAQLRLANLIIIRFRIIFTELRITTPGVRGRVIPLNYKISVSAQVSMDDVRCNERQKSSNSNLPNLPLIVRFVTILITKSLIY